MTVWARTADPAPKVLLPAYVAVMANVPAGSDEMFALPTPPTNVEVPRDVLPFMNVTLPLGVPTDEVTVAVKVTDCPYVEGFADEASATNVIAGFTCWVRIAEVLPGNTLVPAYTAVIELLPTLNVFLDSAATPSESVALPSVALPLMNVTLPVGVPAEEVTFAVKVTDCPYVEGFADEVSATEVAPGFTCCVRIVEVLPETSLVPAYTAVIELLPTVKVPLANVATPAESVALPRTALPFMNVTLPVGVPADAVTVAVNVTDCPLVEGFADDVEG